MVIYPRFVMRREQRRRREERRAAKGSLHQLADQTRGAYIPPDRQECFAKEYYETLDDSNTLRIETRIWRSEKRLVDLVLLLRALDWDEWTTVARVDCCWGFCHLHPPGDDSRHEAIVRLDSVDDVERAFALAHGRLTEVGYRIRDRREDA